MSFEARAEVAPIKQASKVLPINSIGEILVGVRSRRDDKRPGQLDFIGGGQEPTDEGCSLKTAVRELREEIGLRKRSEEMYYINEDMSPSGNTLVSLYWTVVPNGFIPRVQSSELEKVVALPPADVLRGLLHVGQIAMLEHFLEVSRPVEQFDFSEELALQSFIH